MNDSVQDTAAEPDLIEQAKQFNIQGNQYKEANALDLAEAAYRKAIELNPEYEAAYSNLVSALERQNNIAEARKYVDLSNRLFPEGTFITLNEALILKREGRLKEAEELLKTKPYPQDAMTEMKVRHELGLIYDRLGQTDLAFEQFQSFNTFASQAFGFNDAQKRVYLQNLDRYKQAFSPDFVKNLSAIEPAPKTPICLMGFARSGTTLLQHILNSHPQIYASEEVHAFARIEDHLMKNLPCYPADLARLSSANIQELRQAYFSIHHQDQAFREADILVDKYPMLANMTGLVERLFPGSKYIFIVRHPMDVILSCYMQFFVPNPATVHFYDLDDLVHLYSKFMALWGHYEQAMDLDVHYVKYEDIVSKFNREISDVLNFIGVPWDDAVLNYNENAQKLNIISPSYEQVSEKIYDRASYRWERYKEHLSQYTDQLAPYIEKFGYSKS